MHLITFSSILRVSLMEYGAAVLPVPYRQFGIGIRHYYGISAACLPVWHLEPETSS